MRKKIERWWNNRNSFKYSIRWRKSTNKFLKKRWKVVNWTWGSTWFLSRCLRISCAAASILQRHRLTNRFNNKSNSTRSRLKAKLAWMRWSGANLNKRFWLSPCRLNMLTKILSFKRTTVTTCPLGKAKKRLKNHPKLFKICFRRHIAMRIAKCSNYRRNRQELLSTTSLMSVWVALTTWKTALNLKLSL
jgi:hypothetical protein